jgi:hypothetical protein
MFTWGHGKILNCERMTCGNLYCTQRTIARCKHAGIDVNRVFVLVLKYARFILCCLQIFLLG